MIRSLASILAALHAVAPGFQPKAELATELRELGATHDLDPFTLMAVGERESRWRTDVIGKLGEVGPMQIMPVNFASCREDRAGDECEATLRVMSDWRRNLGFAAGLMQIQRDYCKRVVGSALAVHWLQEYQGYAGTCGHRKVRGRWVALPVPKGTSQVLERRRDLARRF